MTLLAILNILVGVLLLLGALGLFLAMSLAGDPVFQEALADSDVPECSWTSSPCSWGSWERSP